MRQFEQLKDFIFDKLRSELPAHLSYHNIGHTKDVMQATGFLAASEGIDDKGRALLQTAALLHDSGFLVKREGHEDSSCNIAHDYLPRYGYTATEVEEVCRIIMATQLPQSPQDKLGEILCDADLDYLGREDFFTLSDKLFGELKNEGLIKDEEEWNRQQADFISGHSYFTQTAVNLRQPVKDRYIELIKLKISA